MNRQNPPMNDDEEALLWWIVFAIVAAVLWWPRYDLEIARNPGPAGYEIVEYDFMLLGNCIEAAARWHAYDWSCLEKTVWGEIFNEYSRYNQRTR